ncbi:MAG: prolipoprotein diacylglyceryl transferase [Clostridiales bacterium]|jgi:phosphatidylglycerol:prolipoprotein diacylglycerol transferase|nr:prolipoprotein diacylglyceryl transferase [Clostridiales bacterium]
MKNTVFFPKFGFEIKINNIAFEIMKFKIYWYGIIICFGTLLAIFYGFHECEKKKIKSDDVSNMLLIGMPISIFCARFYYVCFKFEDFKERKFLEIINIREGGIAIYGAIIGAIITGLIYTKIKKIPFLPLLDIFGICLLIGQSIGRWGNFINCEAYGTHTNLPWAMSISGQINANNVHPTFLYESLWNALGILILNLYKKNIKFKGELFCAYMFWYGIGRTFIEEIRADSLMFFSFKISQVLSIIITLIGLSIILFKRFKKINNQLN